MRAIKDVISSNTFPITLPCHPSIDRLAPEIDQAITRRTSSCPFLYRTNDHPLRRDNVNVHFHTTSTIISALCSTGTKGLHQVARTVKLLHTSDYTFLRNVSVDKCTSPRNAARLGQGLSTGHTRTLQRTLSIHVGLPMSLFRLGTKKMS